jgi:hypothetical protein
MDARNKFLESYKKKAQEQDPNAHVGDSLAESVNEGKKGESQGEEVSLKFDQKPGFVKPEQKPMTPAPKSSKKFKRYISISLGVVILLAIIIGTVLLFNRGVEAIDLVGWTENDAQLWAREKGINLQVEKEYSDEVEAGKIISQSVTKGTRIKKGEFMQVLVSLGHDLSVTLPLPDLMSMTKEEIEAWAAENFMAKVRITAEHSLDVPVGGVIRYEINDDTVVDEVSNGLAIKGPTAIMNTEAMAVRVIQTPMERESFSRSFAPKYWATIIPAPVEIPINNTIKRFSIGPALPTAARALSPIYFPTIMESAVL